ncbi:MAG: benzoyl-CoA-dihydrodiol lyase [Rhodospirillaceae bacterium]|nr:benzoyl-CoA-dihydrodiol lyase [Rhodospirillaceae bacterium]
MQEIEAKLVDLDFRTEPNSYHHWKISIDGELAFLEMDVDENVCALGGYELKLNSYDIGVDIELYDAIQRLRFEHPEVKAVVIQSGKPGTFCAGANIRMLGSASHFHKVNFCKFTNETRNALEEASKYSGQIYLCALSGAAAGGGYELALATEYIMLIDDGNAAVSLPEVPLLGVLPGTGGLTRLVDKRGVRRDLADVFCTIEEGIKGERALQWRLIDELIPRSKFESKVREKALSFTKTSDRPNNEKGIKLNRLDKKSNETKVRYPFLTMELDRVGRTVTLTLEGPIDDCNNIDTAKCQGGDFWPLALFRAFDDALLHLRFNEPELGTLILKTNGDDSEVSSYSSLLEKNSSDWFIREILLYAQRVYKRLDVTARTTFAFIEPRSCFHGLLAEILFSVDRSYMLDCDENSDLEDAPNISISPLNFEFFRMANGLTRIETRFLGEPESVDRARSLINKKLNGSAALNAGLITFAPDDIDWDDEIRLLLEERASFSPDALTGMEANLRFAGPETAETKIFGRLSAWQNWIFQRPNAAGDESALKLYGTGRRANYDRKRT